jgi:hypothetical protein
LPDDHPDWLDLDRLIPADHLARRIRAVVEPLDLSGLLDSFAGVGSPVHPPDLLLQFVLFELHRKHLSPATWLVQSRESNPARWLLRGLRPARCALYRFRRHLPVELLDKLNHQVLHLAQDEGHTSATCGALDGTFHAAAGSRHRLLNLKALEQRCEQLDAQVALDEQDAPDALAAASALAALPAPPQPPAAIAEPACPGSDGVVVNEASAAAARQPVQASNVTPEAGPTQQAKVATTVSPQPPGAIAEPACPDSVVVAANEASAADARQSAQPSNATPEAGPTQQTEAKPPPPPGWMAGSEQGRKRQRQRYQQARQTLKQRLQEHDKKQRRQRKAKRRSAEQVKICPSEPQAVLGKDKMKVFRPLYNTQILQDIDSPFVLGYGVYASVSDAGLLPPMLSRSKELTGRELHELLADGIYGRLLDVRDCKERGIRLYAPVASSTTPELDKAKEKDKDQEAAIGKEQFEWLAFEHTYRCPKGHLLQLERCCAEERREGEKVMVEQYRCAAEHCGECPLASRCTKRPDKGRTVKRMQGQELLDEVGARMASAEGKERYRKRKQTVERSHADFRAHRGLDRFRGYGLAAAQSLIALLVLAHNGLALLDARDAKKEKNKSR